VQTAEGNKLVLPGPLAAYDSLTYDELNVECDNLVDLDNFNEGIILHHTRNRYLSNKIYTFVGSILIAVNPYKKLDIYGVDIMEEILNLTRNGETLPANVFSIAAEALHGMRSDGKSQSILISGSSIYFIYDWLL
jgi:myosin heavy subunit